MKKFILLTAFIVAGVLSISQTQDVMTVKLKDGTVHEFKVDDVSEVTFQASESPNELLNCPDNNHPHLIDLGLPSGTKWACCNVGSVTPEEYGGHYAWGEIEEKNYYSWGTYEYCNGSYKTCFYLGEDIAGTQYDVAHVKWGDPWRMPSVEQIDELIDNCSREWATQNGVNGTLVTGPNSATIFIPAAGYRTHDFGHNAEGMYGLYWSSSLYPGGSGGDAYILEFSSERWSHYDDYRYNGNSVRAVAKPSSSLSLSQYYVRLIVGESAIIDVTDGSGNYTVSVDAPTLVAASLSGSSITIKGINAGLAVVTVIDTSTGQIANITVTVSEAPSLVISNNSVELIAGGSSIIEIISGSGNYEISNSNANVVQAILDGTKIKLTAKAEGNAVVTVKDKATTQTASVSVTVNPIPSLVLSQSNVDLTVGTEATVEIVSGSGEYSVAIDKPSIVTASLSSTIIAIKGVDVGIAIVSVKDLSSGKMADINVTVSSSTGDCPVAEAIDLGLPSGTKWASWNVGATKPEDYGGYYAWGEIEEKNYYSWGTYKYCNGSYKTCSYIGDDIAGSQYDVAHVKWGGTWKLPSLAQIEELIDKCTRTLTTLNGVDGSLFTGPNGASIFLPSARRIQGDSLKGGNLSGYYWSSTLYLELKHGARNLVFSKDYVLCSNSGRFCGLTVRAVCGPSSPPSLSLSQYVVSLTVGGSTIIDITDGSGNYSITNNNADIVKATLSGAKITVEAIKTGSATITVEDLGLNQKATISVIITVNSNLTCPDNNHPHIIDLGLPSGTKWACCNIGANSPKGYGDYYAWGEIEEKSYYDWDTYTYYNIHIGDDIAGTEYDVAHVKWGG